MRFIVVSALALWLLAAPTRSQTPPSPTTTTEGFAIPQPNPRFTFPRDHGNHPQFKIEWWYVTGHLYAAATATVPARRFGYQATFFRQAAPLTSALATTAAPPATSPAFGDAQLYLAHMALLDVQTGRFLHQERLNREGWDAASSATTLDVRNGDWSLRLVDPADSSTTPPLFLRGGVRADAAFTLTLTPAKPLVLFGDAGVSRKGADPSAASHYLTFTRIHTAGELTLRTDAGTEKIRVTGESWMDHEISSSQLSAGQVGWDWLSIHFTDGREVMLYRLRLRDGTADPASTLTWIDATGRTTRAPHTWEVLDRWTSPATGAIYPSRLRVTTTDPATNQSVALTLEPLARAQELTGGLGGIPYWEGACRVRDASGRELGSAYLELTGYARDLKL